MPSRSLYVISETKSPVINVRAHVASRQIFHAQLAHIYSRFTSEMVLKGVIHGVHINYDHYDIKCESRVSVNHKDVIFQNFGLVRVLKDYEIFSIQIY